MARKKTWRSGPPSRSPGSEELHRLYVVEQMSYADIARTHGVTKTTVRRWLRAAGIAVRDTSEATKLGMQSWVPTDEHRQKLRASAARARCGITEESRRKQSATMMGKAPPNKGVPWTDEQRAIHMAYRTTPEYRAKFADARRGEKSHLWKGGATPVDDLRLQGWEWRQRRAECYARDNWTCQSCGVHCTSNGKTRIQAHHLIARRDGGGDELPNLLTLCAACHRRVTHKERLQRKDSQ